MVGSKIPNGMRVWRYNDALCAFDSDTNSLLVCNTDGIVEFLLEGYNSKYAAQHGCNGRKTWSRTIDADLFKNGFMVVYLEEGAYRKPKRYFLVDKKGEFKFRETAFKYIENYLNYFLVKVGSKYGWLDANLAWIIMPLYNKVVYQGKPRDNGGVYSNHVRVKVGKRWGILDEASLMPIVPCIYSSIKLDWDCDWDLSYNSVPAFWKCKRKDNGKYDLLIINYEKGIAKGVFILSLPFENLRDVAWMHRGGKAEDWMSKEGSLCYLDTEDGLMYGIKMESESLMPQLKVLDTPSSLESSLLS